MARGSKAAAIRQYTSEHPEAKAAEIVAALKAQKIKVSTTQVYGIISKSNGKAPAMSRKHEHLTGGPLTYAKALAVAAGGIQQARDVLETLAELQV